MNWENCVTKIKSELHAVEKGMIAHGHVKKYQLSFSCLGGQELGKSEAGWTGQIGRDLQESIPPDLGKT